MTRFGLLALFAIAAGCARAPAPPAPAPAAERASAAPPAAIPEQTLRPDIFFLGTPQPVVDAMLELADVKPDDVL